VRRVASGEIKQSEILKHREFQFWVSKRFRCNILISQNCRARRSRSSGSDEHRCIFTDRRKKGLLKAYPRGSADLSDGDIHAA
jgi:hypothetical protein